MKYLQCVNRRKKERKKEKRKKEIERWFRRVGELFSFSSYAGAVERVAEKKKKNVLLPNPRM